MSRNLPHWLAMAAGGCLLVALVHLPEPGHTATALGAAPEPVALAPGDIDPEASRVYVRVGKRRLGHEHAVEGRLKSGRLVAADEDAGTMVFDMTTFQADTDAARKYVGLEGSTDAQEQSDVTKTMLGKLVLDTAQYPTAKFVIDSARRLPDDNADGQPQYELKGQFTLHGKTRALSVTAAVVSREKDRVNYRGSFTIKQSDYGIKPYSTFGGLVSVADELKIFGDLWVRQPENAGE